MNEYQRRFLPSHSILRSFESAARYESFTLAARELSLTQSAISRQVKELEEIVGTSLFRRVGRHVELTRAGRQFASDVAVDLENLRRTVMRAISGGALRSTLRVATLSTFASRWLIPRLPDFCKTYPDIQLSFATRLNPFALSDDRFDLAIHFGKENWPNARMRKLCQETVLPVASPEFVREYEINQFEDVMRAPLLHLDTRPDAWPHYAQSLGFDGTACLAGKYFDQFTMTISATQAGLGASLVPRYLIEQEIETGALVVLADHEMETENAYFLVTPIDQFEPTVEIFCDWVASQISYASPIHSKTE